MGINLSSFVNLIRKHQFEKALQKLDAVKTIAELNPHIPFYDNIFDLLVQAGCSNGELQRVWDRFVKLDREYKGWTYWQYLAKRNCATALREMHTRNFSINWNARSSCGDSALHTAVKNHNYAAVQTLLEADVDTAVRNKRNLTAEDMAMADEKMKKIFEHHRLDDNFCALREEFDGFRRTTEERLADNEASLEDVKVVLSDLMRRIQSTQPTDSA